MVEIEARKPEQILDLATFKPKFDRIFAARLSKVKEDSQNNYFPLSEHIEYANEMAIKGKSIRPYLAFLTYTAFGGNDGEKAMESLVPLELFHTFSLILDDWMDNGTKRRGMKAVHTHIADKLKEENPNKNPDDLDKRGKSLATITGILLFQWTHDLINKDPNVDEEARKKVQEYYSNMVNQTAKGQAIDVTLPIHDNVESVLIGDKDSLKTASVITGSMLIGAALAKQDTPEVVKFCKDFGLKLGMAYQMLDDIRDIKNPNDSDKTSLADVSQNQHTHLTQFVALRGTTEQKLALSKLRRASQTEESIAEIRRIFTESGAIEFVEKMIEETEAEARHTIDDLQIEEEKKEGFYSLLKNVLNRNN